MTWCISIDRGGTFTDVVAERDDGHVEILKVPTDARDADADAAVEAIRRLTGAPETGPIPASCVREVRCGTTAATNALLERRGEPCALLVTRGFADLLTIGTQARPDIFALHVVRTRPLPVATFEERERVLADGTVRTPLDEDGVAASAAEIVRRGIRSVAVLFLHAYAFPAHEIRAGEILRRAGIASVFLSHESAREIQAVPRGETTAADAYLTPVLRAALGRFRSAFAEDVDVKFVRSDGALAAAATARGPAAVLSGPAGGALAVARIARAHDLPAAIGFDMGGTSTDVCRAAPEPEFRYETCVAGFRLRVPSLRVHTIAAGGGSILGFDGRRLSVGPASAGAHPGPAGYGRGGPATLTDADAVLGRLVPSSFPACFGADGTRPFDVASSRRAIEPLSRAAGLTVEEAAAGFVRVADERVAQAIREESVLRGFDVRTHALVAFGGAGPQHACAVARALGAATVVVPQRSSVLSAWGIATARPAWDRVVPILGPLDHGGAIRLRHEAALLERDLLAQATAEAAGRTRVRVSAELRVRGTDAALEIHVGEGRLGLLQDAFDRAHRRAYGFPPPPGAVIEIVNVRVRVESLGAGHPPASPSGAVTAGVAGVGSAAAARIARAWFHDAYGVLREMEAEVVPSEDVATRGSVDGPALAVSATATVVVEPGWRLVAHATGDLRLEPVAPAPRPRIGRERDPVSLALFANAFMSVAERMGAVLERTSHSTNIKERLDFSCAVFDGAGRLVANAPHVPVHLGAMGESVRAVLASRAKDLREGDCIVTNDPYRGGSHLPDITVVTPVVVEDGVPRFFVANRAHHADVGGIAPGSMPPLSQSIDEEGIRLHDLLLVRDGVLLEAAARAALSAGPHPARAIDERMFDLRAQAAANHEGARLLREMCDEHGGAPARRPGPRALSPGQDAAEDSHGLLGGSADAPDAPTGADVVTAYMRHVQDDGAEAMEEVLRALPEGSHSADDTLDDGTPLRVTVSVRNGLAWIDFAGTGPQSDGNLNAPLAVVRAAVLYAFRTLVRRPIPLNEGCLRPLEIRVPPGSLLDPKPPAAVVGGNVETSQRLVDLVLRAVGACAASQGTMNNVTFGTASWTYYETLGGGTGAGPGFDGASAVQCHMTNTRITDVEVIERLRPVVIRRFEIRPGSGGAGAHRGGDGLVREIEFLAAARGGVLSERRVRGAPGLAGGGDGEPGRNTLIRAGVVATAGRARGGAGVDVGPGTVRDDGTIVGTDASRETSLPGRAAFDVQPGDVLRIETPGGGGWGRAGEAAAHAPGGETRP